MRSYNPVRKGHGGQIRKAVQLLMQASVVIKNCFHEFMHMHSVCFTAV